MELTPQPRYTVSNFESRFSVCQIWKFTVETVSLAGPIFAREVRFYHQGMETKDSVTVVVEQNIFSLW